MVTKREQEIIRKCGMKYSVSSIILFGSAIKEKGARDLDLAVRGIDPALFFKFYAELYKLLPKPVDLVDLDEAGGYFTARILEGGKVIYEA